VSSPRSSASTAVGRNRVKMAPRVLTADRLKESRLKVPSHCTARW